jgi:hypothetical protein
VLTVGAGNRNAGIRRSIRMERRTLQFRDASAIDFVQSTLLGSERTYSAGCSSAKAERRATLRCGTVDIAEPPLSTFEVIRYPPLYD